MRGPQRLAVLPISHKSLFQDFVGERNAAGDACGVSALGQHTDDVLRDL